MTNQYTNEQAFQFGLDSYFEDWSSEKIANIVNNCLDSQFFYQGRDVAAEQDSI